MATYTTPRTWVVGEIVTASQLNTHLRDNIAYLKDVFDGNVAQEIIFGNGTGAQFVNIDGGAGNGRIIKFLSNGSDRWYIFATAEPESGGNAGSDLKINRYDDSGSALGTVLEFVRSTGVAEFAMTPTVAGDDIWHAGNDGSGSGLDADNVRGVAGTNICRIDKGSYSGNGSSSGRQITTGFQCDYVVIIRDDLDRSWYTLDTSGALRLNDGAVGAQSPEIHLHASNGFVVGDTSSEGNISGKTYNYIAFGTTS